MTLCRVVLQRRLLGRLSSQLEHVQAGVDLHNCQDQLLLVRSLGGVHGVNTHLDSLAFGHVKLTGQSDMAAQCADLVLAVGQRLGQIQENRSRVESHRFAQQSSGRVLEFIRAALGGCGKRRERLGVVQRAEDFQELDLRRHRQFRHRRG